MCTLLTRSIRSVLWASFLFFAAATTTSAGGQKLVAVGWDHVAISGYDTVAYFTDGKPMKGSSEFEYVWDDAKWRFASAAHRDLFIADPDRYMPQYGGYCAAAMRKGVLVPADPEAWAIVDGKLYMIHTKPGVGPWKVHAAENVKQADKKWLEQQEPTSWAITRGRHSRASYMACRDPNQARPR